MSELTDIDKGVKLFADGVNGFDYQEQLKHFSKAFRSQHRTLQQSMWRVIFKFIKEYAETGNFDLRNEQAVVTCGSILSAMEKEMGFEWNITANLPTV